MQKYVYSFGGGKAEGAGEMKDLLGGKGAGLAEMTNVGLPVPPGFTITTKACNAYTSLGKQFPDGMWEQVLTALRRVEEWTDKKFGSPENPLLVSVRSGAKFSMPGMMDTVLNLGLNTATLAGLARLTNNDRFAYDAYRRFMQMFGKIVLGVDPALFEYTFETFKKKAKARTDTDLDAGTLQQICAEFQKIIKVATGKPFPTDPFVQLELAIRAVFASWNGERAVVYRKHHKIPDDLGTAVNVVTMVFGNMGEDSGTGVAFTRNPATGEKVLYGDYLPNAQGEDVVAGIRNTKPISQLRDEMPVVYRQFEEVALKLEKHYRDVQDLEFTIEKGKLWMLQTRNAKRTGPAAVRIAVEMAEEGLISKSEAVLRVEPDSLNQLLHKRIDPKAKVNLLARGVGASPGAASGQVVFDPVEAERLNEKGHRVILVRTETSPEDIRGMIAAQAILTSRGGPTSHAAVVARGWGKCCVVGAEAVRIDYRKHQFVVNSYRVKKGNWITLNGTSGEVILGQAPLVDPELGGHFQTLMEWADAFRRLRVRTNADTPGDSAIARQFGAEGIGLCRTEHMFFNEDRIDTVRQMIMVSADFKRCEKQLQELESEIEGANGDRLKNLKAQRAGILKDLAEPKRLYFGALQKLLPMQRKDFIGIFTAMSGLPVTIRTLDPPLHEFLPHDDEKIRKLSRKIGIPAAELTAGVKALSESNPMLGHRGCRLGIVYPEITAMQARAIFEAAVAVTKKGIDVHPEIMIPLVAHVNELRVQAQVVRSVADEVMKKANVNIDYLVGTMIELPRAALTADEVAQVAEFFSFGTNDLTQTTFGLSRDDSARFLPFYLDNKILAEDPFQQLDVSGVGKLVEVGVKLGRAVNPKLKVGICGEHGGDPSSVVFCHRIGLDYVSCSPYRVPIARLAAAQAAMTNEKVESRTA